VDGICSTDGEDEEWMQNLTWIPEEKTPISTHRHRCEDNIKIDLI
jgi:hypothetical protein